MNLRKIIFYTTKLIINCIIKMIQLYLYLYQNSMKWEKI